MAKISIAPALGSDSLSSKFSGAMTIGQHSVKAATFVEAGEGDRIVFAGSGLTYTGNDMTGGKISTITFRNAEGDVYAIFSNLDIKASKFPDFEAAGDKIDFFDFLKKGDDKITGTNSQNNLDGGAGDDIMFGNGGDDNIDGGIGNDTMSGGNGHDSFVFGHGLGRDVITDFRGTGPLDQRDTLAVFADFTLKRSGQDVIVDLDESSNFVRLLGVKVAQVQDDIFEI
jgi:Ca2+-binding RTX toxin-like protein